MSPSSLSSSVRLYVDAPFEVDHPVCLEEGQVHYLKHVLRLRDAETIRIFNGRQGEWEGTLTMSGKKRLCVLPVSCLKAQQSASDLVYAFAPLKQARLDYLVQKATEMGAGLLQPVITRRCQVSRLNIARIKTNIIEAAEQCGLLTLPPIGEECSLDEFLMSWPPLRVLVFCDEEAPYREQSNDQGVSGVSGEQRNGMDLNEKKPEDYLTRLSEQASKIGGILIGPEGGFDPQERTQLLEYNATLRLSLGPRILRADTAAVAALALVQAVRGE
jgi:16S rRNA (uracil1498-N3)-methyltransferase